MQLYKYRHRTSGKLLAAALLFVLCSPLVMAQLTGVAAPVAPATPPPADPLNRISPQDAVYGFLQACESKNYVRAALFLDLRQLTAADRRRQGPQLAMQLREILDHDVDFDVTELSSQPNGDRSDGLAANLERIASFTIAGQHIEVRLAHVEQHSGRVVWLFSSDTVAEIPSVQALLGESAFEKRLPAPLVNWKFLDTPLWQWIALALLALSLAFLAKLISRGALLLVKPLMKGATPTFDFNRLSYLIGPLGLLIGLLVFRAGLELIGPSALVRFYATRLLTLLMFLAVGWIVTRVLDIIAGRLQSVADPRQQALFFSVLPLGVRVAKICVVAVAILSTLSAWGYNTNTLWATLGVGSLAVALAAQKTLENFFGGVSVISDRPVLVGDLCQVGDKFGTVEDIGLRSTRIRTNDRTVVTVPNSQFSTMTLENFSKRDKLWFHPTLTLRCDATPAQVRQVLAAFTELLKSTPLVEVGDLPARFTTIGSYSYNIEIFAYVLTTDYDKFLMIQQDTLLKMIDIVEAAGTGLAVPLQETLMAQSPQPDKPAPPSGDSGSPLAGAR